MTTNVGEWKVWNKVGWTYVCSETRKGNYLHFVWPFTTPDPPPIVLGLTLPPDPRNVTEPGSVQSLKTNPLMRTPLLERHHCHPLGMHNEVARIIFSIRRGRPLSSNMYFHFKWVLDALEIDFERFHLSVFHFPYNPRRFNIKTKEIVNQPWIGQIATLMTLQGLLLGHFGVL